MTRGKKPVAACAEAKKFAERMGYQWLENPDTIYEKLIPDDLREVRALPFPPWFPKEIWLAHPARAGVAAAPGPSDLCSRDRMVGAGRLHEPLLPVGNLSIRASSL